MSVYGIDDVSTSYPEYGCAYGYVAAAASVYGSASTYVHVVTHTMTYVSVATSTLPAGCVLVCRHRGMNIRQRKHIRSYRYDNRRIHRRILVRRRCNRRSLTWCRLNDEHRRIHIRRSNLHIRRMRHTRIHITINRHITPSITRHIRQPIHIRIRIHIPRCHWQHRHIHRTHITHHSSIRRIHIH